MKNSERSSRIYLQGISEAKKITVDMVESIFTRGVKKRRTEGELMKN